MTAKFAASKCVLLVVVFLLASLSCASPALAQTASTGAIVGTVTDPSGAVISGASITLTNMGTGQARDAKSDSTGLYKFSLLPPGNYSVKFSASGFKTAEATSINVNVTETAVVNHSLEVGAQTQQVTVEATTERLQTENATVGTLVGTKELTELPLSGRNYTQIIDLSPGVVVNVATASAIGNGTQDINVNGSGSNQNNYLMDGVSQTNYGSGGGAQSGNFPGIGIPNPDSIEEFRIQTSQYDAGYGRNPGASVSVTTKSGTNRFHGAAWEFYRDTVLNANDKFNKLGEALFKEPNKQQPLSQNEFGGTLGGPIKKDKLFFFGSYQGFRQKNGIGSNGFATGVSSDATFLPVDLPDGTRKDESGTMPLHWSSIPGAPTCNYTTYRTYLGCVFGGIPFGPGATCIPFFFSPPPNQPMPTCNFGLGTSTFVAQDGSNINQAAINILQAKGSNGKYNHGFYFPSMPFSGGKPVCDWNFTPAGQAAPNCARSLSDPLIANEDQYLLNSDWVYNSKNTISTRYFFSKDPQIQTMICLGLSGPNQCLPGGAENASYTATNAVLKLATVISSNLVNDVHTSFQRQTTIEDAHTYISSCSVGISPMLNNSQPCPEAVPNGFPSLNQIPTFSILGLIGGMGGGWNQGGNFFSTNRSIFNTWEAADNLSWNHGKHAIRVGFEYDRLQDNGLLPGRGGDIFLNVADFLTSSSGAPATGTAPGVNTGGLINFTGAVGLPQGSGYALRINGFNAYGQDDIKLTSKFTLNLGVRWEYFGWPTNVNGAFTNTWASQAALTNTGSFFLGNQVANGPGNPFDANQVGTLVGFVVQSNYNPNLHQCGIPTSLAPCGSTAPAGVFTSFLQQNGAGPSITYNYVGGATGIYTNTNKTLVHGFPTYAFAPRFGFAWQAINKMVVRGGYGIFYDRVYGNLLSNNQVGNPPANAPAAAPPPGAAAAQQTLDTPFTVPAKYGWTPRTLWVANAPDPVNGATSILALDGGVGLGTTTDSEWLGVPLIQQYNVDLQYQIGHNWVADIGYVGTHGIHLYDWNRPINVGLLASGATNGPAAGDKQNQMMVVGSGFGGTPSSLPFNDPGNSNFETQIHQNLLTNVAGRVSYLGFGTGGFTDTGTFGDSVYNSLQASLKHQFASGLFLQASYTWSKLTTNVNASVSGAGIAAGGNVLSGNAGSNDPLNMAQQYGPAAFNRSQRLVVAYSYSLPHKNTEGFSGKALSGWSVSGVTTIQNGTPFTVTDGRAGGIYYGAPLGTASIPFGSSQGRAELASPTNCNSLGVCQSSVPIATSGSNNSRLGGAFGGSGWVNAKAFTAPPCIGGTVVGACALSGGGDGWGNSAVGSITGPGQNNWDFSIMKSTPIKESITLQFRTEFYNIWNHPQYNPPINDFNNPSFGQITSSSVPPRVIQFGLKLLF